MSNIDVGSVVVLKSGGPTMTVHSIEGDSVDCTWFDKNNEYRSSMFNIATIKIYEEPTRGFFAG